MKLIWNESAYAIPEATVTYGWGGSYPSSEYAADVYFGYSGPARPWADHVIDDEEDILDDLLLNSVVRDDFAQTFINFGFALGFAFQDAIEADIWYWPNRTERSDGTIVDSPRDIVDTGALRDSQTIDFTGV